MGMTEEDGTADEAGMKPVLTGGGNMPGGSDAEWVTPMPKADATDPGTMPKSLEDAAEAAVEASGPAEE